ncbi:MAG: hypothetical protein K6E53_09585 [Lachnospiraceae bacterium]|nr:hypothetical protein [Lachnospiraceae bacterium]
MEEKLRNLFDFQRFSENPTLQGVIDQTHSRINKSILSDDDMEMVAAAGSNGIIKKETVAGSGICEIIT